MELSWLKYFAEVAQTESMTKAASNLYISQPALSKTIGMLEKELGVTLFDRTGRGMKLSRCGTAYYERIRKILEDLENARKEVLDIAEAPEKTVCLVVAVFNLEIIDLILEFRKEHPDIRIMLENPDVQTENIKNMTFDLAVIMAPYQSGKYEGCCLYEEDMVLVVPPHLDIAGKEHINLLECSQYPLIVPNAPCEKSDIYCDIGIVVEAMCVYAGFVPNVVARTSNIETTMTLMMTYDAVTIMPRGFYQNRYGRQFPSLEIDSPKCTRKIVLIWNKEKYMTDSVKLLKECLCRHFASHHA